MGWRAGLSWLCWLGACSPRECEVRYKMGIVGAGSHFETLPLVVQSSMMGSMRAMSAR